MPDLSVVIPFYNEEENITPLFSELYPILSEMGRSFEIVAVNDGSRDQTLRNLRMAQARYPLLRVIDLGRNTGQTAAFEAGFRAAKGRLIATMDGDLQIDPHDLPRMMNLMEEKQVDFVFGWRKNRKDSFLKRVSTKVANAVRNWLTKESIPDTGCPLKLFRAEILKRMKLFNGMHRFFITLAHMDGWTSAQMIVNHRHRQHGESKYGMWNRVFRALRDCFSVRWMMKRHLKYEAYEVERAELQQGETQAERVVMQEED